LRHAPALLLAGLLALAPAAAPAQQETIREAIDAHAIPAVTRAAAEAADLEDAALADCAPESPALRAALRDAREAWLRAAHLRFGPALEDDRLRRMAGRPAESADALARLLRQQDPTGRDADAHADAPLSTRGFHALDRLLHDPDLRGLGTPDDRCALIQTVAADIARSAAAIRTGWTDGHADAMWSAGAPGNTAYPTQADALRTLLDAVLAGLDGAARRLERGAAQDVATSIDAIADLAAILARPAGAAEAVRTRSGAIADHLAEGDATAARAGIAGLRDTLQGDVARALGLAAED
jgi:predicted lipoprotein